MWKKRKKTVCPNCSSEKVIWKSDFDFEDYGMKGRGIVHEYKCLDCGARIHAYVAISEEE